MSKEFDKYAYYTWAVQSPKYEAQFLRNTYRTHRKKLPKILREDFCGTFALCCEWVKLSPDHQAIGVDFDPEPLDYGRSNRLSKLKKAQASQISLHEQDVTKAKLPPADLVCALNFSYFCLKQRKDMLRYFSRVYSSLRTDGVFILDCFGGSQCYEANMEETYHEEKEFSYFWDQENFNPIDQGAEFSIHFKRKREKRRNSVFHYDWRLWSPAELKDILADAGFSQTLVYWEGTTRKGEGDGVFKPQKIGEECEAWVAYLVALK